FHGILLPQAFGIGLILSDGDQGQRGPPARWRQHVSSDGAAARAGQPVLVGDGLRSHHPWPGPQHGARQPLVATSGPQSECQRVGRHLLWPRRPADQGSELGADVPRGRVRSPLPLLRPREIAVREDMAVAGYREDLKPLLIALTDQEGDQGMATVQNASQTLDTRIGALECTPDFANGYPTDATIAKLYDARDFQRACQAYLWSLP